MDLNALLDQVKRMIFNDPSTPHQEGHDPSGLMGRLEGLFGVQSDNPATTGGYRNVRPASEDPLGDPADMVGSGYGTGYTRASYPYMEGDVRPASEDPLGDPADQMADNSRFGNVRPASEDPLGDPADEERRW
jgi:hypothetical protein